MADATLDDPLDNTQEAVFAPHIYVLGEAPGPNEAAVKNPSGVIAWGRT